MIYKALLDIIAPDHELYLAIDDTIFDKFFTQKATQVIIQRYQFALVPACVVSRQPGKRENRTMDKLTRYRTLIRKFFKEYADLLTAPPKPELDVVMALDDEQGQYLLLKVGWKDNRHVRHTI